MALPVLCIVTMKTCIHCEHMRGNGKLRRVEPSPFESNEAEDKKGPLNYWTHRFFELLMRKPLRIYEVHYADFKSRTVGEVNEFTLEKKTEGEPGKIRQVTYRQGNPKCLDSPNVEPTTLAFEDGQIRKLPLSFESWLAAKIPKDLPNFIVVFPQWLCISGESWDGVLMGDPSWRLTPRVNGYRVEEGKDGLLTVNRSQPFKPKGPLAFVEESLEEGWPSPRKPTVEAQPLVVPQVPRLDVIPTAPITYMRLVPS